MLATTERRLDEEDDKSQVDEITCIIQRQYQRKNTQERLS